MTVSLAMIVKNEEEVLARCLDVVAPQVDEIVIVDTGSDDTTKIIARRYTNCIFDFAWSNDFGAARQFAFDHATTEWVFWLDADDIVMGAEHIRRLTRSRGPEVSTIYCRHIVSRDGYGNITGETWRPRFVRRGSGLWQGRVYESLWASGGVVYDQSVVVEHQPGPGSDPLHRNIAIAEAVLNEDGEQPRLLYHLGRDYASVDATDRALETLLRYLPISDREDERYKALVLMSDIYRRRENWEQAIDVGLTALKVRPTWPDAYFSLAKTYYFVKDWRKVVHWSELGEMMAEPETLTGSNPMDYRLNWIIYYTNALHHVGRDEDALLWTREALSLAPGDPWHSENERFFAGKLGKAPTHTWRTQEDL